MKRFLLAGFAAALLRYRNYGPPSKGPLLVERVWLALLVSACLVLTSSPLCLLASPLLASSLRLALLSRADQRWAGARASARLISPISNSTRARSIRLRALSRTPRRRLNFREAARTEGPGVTCIRYPSTAVCVSLGYEDV